MSSSPWHLLFLVFVSSLLFTAGKSQTAAPSPQPSPRTDPVEVAAVEAVFAKLRIPMSWRTTTDPCSGNATDPNVEPLVEKVIIRCDCSSTVCHIKLLKIYGQSATGPIPEELQNLTYLSTLILNRNYLSGPLPSFLGNLTKMRFLAVGTNALSGVIPKELGNLKNLVKLSFGTNNFSGPLPPELGNLINLEQLFMNSAGVSGEIPPTFSKLQNLRIIWAIDNNFTGKIPDFFGSFTNLTELRLQGTSLQGPIPSSFSNLTNLEILIIGDITTGVSSLDFTKDMKSLTILILRNAKITDIIPSSISEIPKLAHLDLSFNNLSGLIPVSLFNMRMLTVLFLGNNGFSGGLPLSKSESLQTIDLSYNNLEGDFPSWISQKDLKLNLVANNFAIKDSGISGIKEGLECLQKNIPCRRGSPIWFNFAINCGGNRSITASDKLVYEKDNEDITRASYYVSPERRWAVSNVGVFLDSPTGISYGELTSSPRFSVSGNSPVSVDTELFRSSRISASSLRYYGIGLESGAYIVELQFAELKFPDAPPLGPPDFGSLGRRVFDIYIQGKLERKDFDIRKETGGKSYEIFKMNFIAYVTDNFLEIHLFWAGKGTCCIPTQGYHGPVISAIDVKPNFIPTVSNQLPGTRSKHKAMIIGVVVGTVTLSFLLASGLFFWIKKRNDFDVDELFGLDVKSEIFSYTQLRTATGDFSPANKLGEGGFGAVFKGELQDGRAVAVKRLSIISHHGKQQFLAEMDIITTVLHRNLVKLYGCCFERNRRLLVYEYLENKSLDQALFGTSGLRLDWPARFNICLGIAKGLEYLHEDSSSRIVHRDIKASNILLDCDLNPKISDFGLAKLFDDTKTHISTRIAGTIGYLAPEYALRGHLTEKADVFSFGVLALEIVSGRSHTDLSLNEEMVYLLEWVWHLHENNLKLELVDPKLESYDREEALRMIRVALVCTQQSPFLRPSMSKAVSMLLGDTPAGNITSKPAYLTDWHLKDLTSGSYTSNASSSTSGVQSRIIQTGFSSTEKSWYGASPSPKDDRAMLHGTIGDGR